MKLLRKYGKAPYAVALIHGGPGACGEMGATARQVSGKCGILEPMQREKSISGQARGLKKVLEKNAKLPAILVGYSWGAWLAFIFAARYPKLVKKIVLVSSGPFEEKYSRGITEARMGRLSAKKRARLDALLASLSSKKGGDNDKIMGEAGKIIGEADAYSPMRQKGERVECDYEVYKSIWREARAMRASGKLLGLGKKIKCPVVAIHGDYDPHPAKGVRLPLSSMLKDFRFIMIEKCGHAPWAERHAKKKFIGILKKEITT